MSSLFRLVMLLAAAAVTNQPARMSMDKVSYPDALPDRKLTDQLPLINKMMGEVPENVLADQWVSLSGDTDRAKRLRDKLALLKIGANGTEFAASGGPAGASDTLIGLTDGRITRVVLVFPEKLSWDDAERKLRDYSVQSVSAERGTTMHRYWGEIDKGNAKYYARVIGYWEQTVPATTRKQYNTNGTVTIIPVPAQETNGPTGLVFDIDAVSWALANTVRPEVADSVRAHKLESGMTESEARVAMFGKLSRTVQNNGVTKLQFFQPPPGAQLDGGNRGGGNGGGAQQAGMANTTPATPQQPVTVESNGQPARGRRRNGRNGGAAIPQPQPNNANATETPAAPPADKNYTGSVDIPNRGLADDVDFTQDTGNIQPRAILVASAVVVDGHLEHVN